MGFIRGDYEYSTIDDGTAFAKPVDKTKSSYETVLTEIERLGRTYIVTQVSYYDCSNLVIAPTIPSSITDLSGCFRNCTSLTSAMIHDGVTNISECFRDCISLVTPPTIPSSVEDMSFCFYGCESLVTPPTIPSGVKYMNGSFDCCISLTTPPAIPSSVEIMAWCFEGCDMLTSAPAIPSSVTSMQGCFERCLSLSGNVVVSNDYLSLEYDMFKGTMNDIYIVPSGLSASGIENWREIASEYGNVHYYTDDAEISLDSLTAMRVSSSGSTTETNNGTYAYIRAPYTLRYVPSGVTLNVSKALTMDGAALSPTWTDSNGVLTAWTTSAPIGDTHTYELTLTVSESASALSVILATSFALVSFHEGGDGISFGERATGAGFNVSMDMSCYGSQMFPLFIWDSTHVSPESYAGTYPASPCFVYYLPDNGLYYCTDN